MAFGAVIVAAGSSTRFAGSTPKQFAPLGDRPVLWYSVKLLAYDERIAETVVCASREHYKTASEIVSSMPATVVEGGATRQESVKRGLEALSPDIETVAIHDGVRPLITADLIDRLLSAAMEHEAVAPALPIAETIKETDEARIAKTIDRSNLWVVQTPQVFSLRLILDAHEKAEADGFSATDDCQLVERLGVTVAVVEGERTNIKITTSEDLLLAETIVRAQRSEQGG